MNDLVSALSTTCKTVLTNGHFTSTAEQVNHILSEEHGGISFYHWYMANFLPVLQTAQRDVAKSADKAAKFKEFADLYQTMVEEEEEPHFVEKAFQSLNKAILWAPPSNRRFLFECFVRRSNLHYRAKDYESALIDIEHALALRPSISCVQHKLELLKHLNRGPQAYITVCDLLASQRFTEPKKIGQLRNWKAELKHYKRNGDANETQVGTCPQKPVCYISMNSKATVYRDTFNKRCGLKATGDIEEGVNVLVEQPVMHILSPHAAKLYCAHCVADCANTFWPCPGCVDVVYCSERCAISDTDHKAECSGLTGLMFAHLAPQAMQVYRHLASNGPEQLLAIDNKTKIYPCKKLNDILTTADAPNLDQTAIRAAFASVQAEVRHRVTNQSPFRTETELGSAVLLLALYMAARGVEQSKSDLSKYSPDNIASLICILATELTKVELTKYMWHNENIKGEKFRMGSLQCLVASRVAHSCQPNATWSYDHRTQRLVVKTIKPVSKGEPITISYGNLESYSFIERQSRLQVFTQMCACAKCLAESRDHFALRCQHCNGAIPYDARQFHNTQCMRCETRHPELTKTKVQNILRHFHSVRAAINLIEVANEQQLRWIEAKMSNLSVVIDLCNHQLLDSIDRLCNEYIRRKKYQTAVEWYQWLLNGIEVHLSWHSNPFVYFSRANRWATAFTDYLEQCFKQKEHEPKTQSEHLEVAESIFRRIFSLLEMLNMKSTTCNESAMRRDEFVQLIDSLNKTAKTNYRRFKSIACMVNGEEKAKQKLLVLNVLQDNFSADKSDTKK